MNRLNRFLPLGFTMMLLALLFTQCEGDVMIEAESQIVVEGIIDDGGYPVVIVTLTLPISTEEHSLDELKDHIVRWVKVSISDGSNTVVMTGRYHEGYFPPYIYTTTEMRGEAGKNYTLTVDYRNHHATATTYIPAKAVPDSIVMRPITDATTMVGTEYLPLYYQAYAYFHDDPLAKDYYACFTRTGSTQRQYLLSQFSAIDDATLLEESAIPIYRGHSSITGKYQRYFRYNEEMAVKFARVDSVSYSILRNYQDNLFLASRLFMQSTQNLPSNIQGGLGYWIGCGASFSYFQTPLRLQ